MKSLQNQNTNNYFFIGFLVIALIAIIFTLSIASEQDAQYKQDYLIYQKYITDINKGNYQEAEKVIQLMLPKYNDNHLMQWHYGVILMGQGKYAEAEEHMRLAREIRPALVTQPDYLVNYGEVMFKLKNLEVAERYLNESLKYNDSKYKPKALELIQLVKKDGGR